MLNRERISSVDHAWLRMDHPGNLMMIVGVLVLDTPLSATRFKRLLEMRLLRYARFRQRVVEDAAGAWWENDPAFDLDRHVHRATLPGAGDKRELEKLAAQLAATPLDHQHPLWCFHLIEHYDGGSALVARLHHCIADGIALIGVMLSLTDAQAGAEPDALAATQLPVAADDENPWRQLFEPATQAMISAIDFSSRVWIKYFELLTNPGLVLDYTRQGAGMARELATLLTLPADSPTRLKGQPAGIKCLAWTEPFPLAEIKASGKALGCSVNDVLLSAMAGALRAYLAQHGDSVEALEVRVLVPVNLREAGDEQQLGNRFGMVTLLLPVGMENPLERVFEVKRRMAALKDSYQPTVTLGLLGALGYAPKLVQQQVLDMLAAKVTAVMTNVPGPQQRLYLAGASLKQQMFWVPQSGDIGVGVSILSYAGSVQFGVITDKRLVADPEKILRHVGPELKKLARVAKGKKA